MPLAPSLLFPVFSTEAPSLGGLQWLGWKAALPQSASQQWVWPESKLWPAGVWEEVCLAQVRSFLEREYLAFCHLSLWWAVWCTEGTEPAQARAEGHTWGGGHPGRTQA